MDIALIEVQVDYRFRHSLFGSGCVGRDGVAQGWFRSDLCLFAIPSWVNLRAGVTITLKRLLISLGFRSYGRQD
jgi:hypothetical protein